MINGQLAAPRRGGSARRAPRASRQVPAAHRARGVRRARGRGRRGSEARSAASRRRQKPPGSWASRVAASASCPGGAAVDERRACAPGRRTPHEVGSSSPPTRRAAAGRLACGRRLARIDSAALISTASCRASLREAMLPPIQRAGRSGSGRGGCTPAGGCPGRARSAGRTARAAGRSGRRESSICSNSSSASARRPVRRYASISHAVQMWKPPSLAGQAVVPAVAVDDRAAAQVRLDRQHGGQEARVVVGQQPGQADPQRRRVHLRRRRRRPCRRRRSSCQPCSSTFSAIWSRSSRPLRAGPRRRAARTTLQRPVDGQPAHDLGVDVVPRRAGGPPRCRGRARASAARPPRPCASSDPPLVVADRAAQRRRRPRAGRRPGRTRRAGPGGWRRCRPGPAGSRRSRAASR